MASQRIDPIGPASARAATIAALRPVERDPDPDAGRRRRAERESRRRAAQRFGPRGPDDQGHVDIVA